MPPFHSDDLYVRAFSKTATVPTFPVNYRFAFDANNSFAQYGRERTANEPLIIDQKANWDETFSIDFWKIGDWDKE